MNCCYLLPYEVCYHYYYFYRIEKCSSLFMSPVSVYPLLFKTFTKNLILLTGIKYLLELLNRGFWNLCCTSTNLSLVHFVLLCGLAIHIWVHYCKKFHTFSVTSNGSFTCCQWFIFCIFSLAGGWIMLVL